MIMDYELDWVAGVPSAGFRVPSIEITQRPVLSEVEGSNTQNHPHAPRPAHRFVNK
jgi:hypothetical protein